MPLGDFRLGPSDGIAGKLDWSWEFSSSNFSPNADPAKADPLDYVSNS